MNKEKKELVNVPTIIVDASLDKYSGKVLCPKKFELAKSFMVIVEDQSLHAKSGVLKPKNESIFDSF